MTTKNMRAGPTRDFQVRIQKHGFMLRYRKALTTAREPKKHGE